MDNVKPNEVIRQLIELGVSKSNLKKREILLKGILSGALLVISTILAFTINIETGKGYAGALAFPVGFVIITLLGFELVTGNFATLPMSLLKKKIYGSQLVRNWGYAFAGNLIGSLFFAFLFYFYLTKGGTNFEHPLIGKTIEVATQKSLVYKKLGTTGWFIAFVKAFLCNWMVTMGVVMAFVSSSTIGKIIAIWLPIFTFFTLGLEHCVVNMFVLPTAILFKAPISISDWWLWNQIPATLGNLLGGFLMTGLSLYYLYRNHDEPQLMHNQERKS
ncbi:formate/nitrite transporter family protein [Marivirga sp.]|uniref:formate/nitrite transporter family protein n=1 Tax=Marivirga sp. TaxID=2018662 RepID=UPI002D7F1E13|nr:formate/nitrite transporter family protein [Marivirga sp.]HET8860940.1 formate/nitrite transporter family protein [Marivirga sp.]